MARRRSLPRLSGDFVLIVEGEVHERKVRETCIVESSLRELRGDFVVVGEGEVRESGVRDSVEGCKLVTVRSRLKVPTLSKRRKLLERLLLPLLLPLDLKPWHMRVRDVLLPMTWNGTHLTWNGARRKRQAALSDVRLPSERPRQRSCRR